MLLFDADGQPIVESAINKQLARFGGEVANRNADRPKLAPGLSLFLTSFYDLDTERDLASLQPIPWSAIIRYGEFNGFSHSELNDLLYLVREADNAYLLHLSQRRKRGK